MKLKGSKSGSRTDDDGVEDARGGNGGMGFIKLSGSHELLEHGGVRNHTYEGSITPYTSAKVDTQMVKQNIKNRADVIQKSWLYALACF